MDEKPLVIIYEKYHHRVFLYLYSLCRDEKLAEDLTQETFLKAVLSLENDHEKLNGSGYPFGKTGDDLDRNDRLMACVDIYQALTESRPYKKGMSHEQVMEIMNQEVSRGTLDKNIVSDMDKCFGA